MHAVCAHGNPFMISLVYAQTVYQILYPGLPHLLAQVVPLLPLAQQLVQVGDSPLILNLNINRIVYLDRFVNVANHELLQAFSDLKVVIAEGI